MMRATFTRFDACSLICRFLGGLDVRGLDECWPWMHLIGDDGYGEFKFQGKKYKAHRVALGLFVTIPKGKCSLHDCDNPPCCNPFHLYCGTNAQNVADRVARGRSSSTKLDEAKVIEIRNSRLTARELADKFDVEPQCISKVRHRTRWKHVEG
jgi:hypothetical protein